MFQEPVHTYCQAGFSSSLKNKKGACTACTTALLRKWGSKVTREVASTAAGVRPSPGTGALRRSGSASIGAWRSSRFIVRETGGWRFLDGLAMSDAEPA